MTHNIDSISRDDVLKLLVKNIYSEGIINNSHRGDIVEMMALAALGDDWKFVGLGWYPWDLQRGEGKNRVRVQVKQAAALQIWGETKEMSVQFGWRNAPPRGFRKDNPKETIEDRGYFCELIIVGIHLEKDRDKADQVNPQQWEFSVIPAKDLVSAQRSMKLAKVLERWPAVKYDDLSQKVNSLIRQSTDLHRC